MIKYTMEEMEEMGNNSFKNGYNECIKDIAGIIMLVCIIIFPLPPAVNFPISSFL